MALAAGVARRRASRGHGASRFQSAIRIGNTIGRSFTGTRFRSVAS